MSCPLRPSVGSHVPSGTKRAVPVARVAAAPATATTAVAAAPAQDEDSEGRQDEDDDGGQDEDETGRWGEDMHDGPHTKRNRDTTERQLSGVGISGVH